MDWMGSASGYLKFERLEQQDPYLEAQYTLKIENHKLILTYSDACEHDSLYREPRQRFSLFSQSMEGSFEEVANLDLPDNLALFDPITEAGIQALEGFLYLIQSLIQENRGLLGFDFPQKPLHVNGRRHSDAMIDFVEFFNSYMARMLWFQHSMDFERKSWRISEPQLLAGYEDHRLGVYLKASLNNLVSDPTMVITNSWEQPLHSGQPRFRKIRCLSLPIDFEALEQLDSHAGLVYLRINQLVHVMLYDLQQEHFDNILY